MLQVGTEVVGPLEATALTAATEEVGELRESLAIGDDEGDKLVVFQHDTKFVTTRLAAFPSRKLPKLKC